MKNSEDIFNEIREISPYLAGLKKENSFQASDEYFDGLSSRIQQKISAEKKEVKTFSLLSYFKQPQWAVAASLMIILSISVVYYYNHKHNQPQSLAENSNIYWDEILNDNNTIIDRIDENMLVDMLANESNSTNFQFKNTINKADKAVLEDVSNYVDSKYNNDVFNEL
ncbi:MAG: hypothetical protein NTZ33_04965 [Bacteroidetes bacterium]|nr:hypothetical protein [Bacteroidota bacterium]